MRDAEGATRNGSGVIPLAESTILDAADLDASNPRSQKRRLCIVREPARIALAPDLLHQFVLFDGLSDCDLARIATSLQSRAIKAGELYCAEDFGEPGVSFVHSGQCRITILSPSGQHAAVRFVRPGGQFGEIAILAEAVQSPYHLLIDEDGQILRLPARRFRELLQTIPKLNENMLRNLARTAMARADRIYEFSLLDANLRLQAELLRLAQSGIRSGDRVVIAHAPTREAMGTQIGITREVVSRLMQSLAQLSLVLIKRSEIVIPDIKRIEANVARATGRSLSYRGDEPDWE